MKVTEIRVEDENGEDLDYVCKWDNITESLVVVIERTPEFTRGYEEGYADAKDEEGDW